MKVKDPTESCGGMTKEHSHLGHFTKPENLNRGHNSDGPIKGDSLFGPNVTPVVTKRFPVEDPSLAPGQGPVAEGRARQEQRERQQRIDNTRMIQGQKKSDPLKY